MHFIDYAPVIKENEDSAAAPRRIGWRECVELPELGITSVIAKIDTGARTTALHAEDLKVIRGIVSGKPLRALFTVPLPGRERTRHLLCRAKIVDRRKVTDSGGHTEMRYVIQTPIKLGGISWLIEVTLTDRRGMRFSMLLGRTALQGRFLVDTAHSFLIGRRPKKRKPKREDG